MHTVAQEDIDQPIVGIHPKAGACESRVSIDRSGSQSAARRGLRIAYDRLIEAQSSAASRALGLREEATGLHREVTLVAIRAQVEEHLQHLRQVVGIREEAGIARHAALERRRLVVHIAPNHLSTHEAVVFGRSDLHGVDRMKRIIQGVPSTHAAIEILPQQLIHGTLQLILDHHLQHDEVDAAIKVTPTRGEARLLDVLHDRILEAIAHEEMASHLGREAGLTGGGDQIGQIGEIVAHIGLRVELHRVGRRLGSAIEPSFIARLVDRIQIERNRRRNARLMEEQLLDLQIGLVGAFQLGDKLRDFAVERELLRIESVKL